MNKLNPMSKDRLEVVDALRGFAVFAILILHCMEHFLYFVYPQDSPIWLAQLNTFVNDSIFFLFAGKAYAIFALLFGLTFFIQQNNQLKKGKDFGNRFLWRMVLLIVFSEINALVFPGGDVLLLFVIMGILLFITRNWSTKYVFFLAIILLLQPYEWILLFMNKSPYPQLNGELYQEIAQVAKYGTINEFFLINLGKGQLASLLWALESGRVCQTGGLFLMGMLAGRLSLFQESDFNKKFWRNALIISAILFIPLFIISKRVEGYNAIIFDMWQKLSFTIILIASFVLLYWNTSGFRKTTHPLLSYGRMSLTNYLSQSYIGALIFMPIGMNLAPLAGCTISLFIGFSIFILQVWFSNWWLKSYRFGPLEGIWHKWTWSKSDRKTNLKKQKVALK